MCEECREATRTAIVALVGAWKTTTPGAALIARMLELADGADSRAPSVRAEIVNQIMLDAYESQRRDAISITAGLITSFTMIKSRLLDEAGRAGDKRVVNLEWDDVQNGYHLRAKDINGNPIERFEPIAFGENAAQAAVRISLGHLGSIGEIHE